MITLFRKYADEGRITETLMIGQNMINKVPGEKESFESYFSFLCNLAERLPSLDERIQFFDQANAVLSFFVENTELNEDVIEEIKKYQNRLEMIGRALQTERETKKTIEEKEIRRKNDAHLKKLYSLKDKLLKAETKTDFDKTLKEIRDVDLLIDKSTLNAKQNDAYDDLAKENTEIMSEIMRKLEHKERVNYNKEAAEAFRKAFEEFKNNENKYNEDQEQLYNLASTTLFYYDAAKLFNETLIYYNHVYSYIFSKLGNDGKLALTRYSIECERKLR